MFWVTKKVVWVTYWVPRGWTQVEKKSLSKKFFQPVLSLIDTEKKFFFAKMVQLEEALGACCMHKFGHLYIFLDTREPNSTLPTQKNVVQIYCHGTPGSSSSTKKIFWGGWKKNFFHKIFFSQNDLSDPKKCFGWQKKWFG